MSEHRVETDRPLLDTLRWISAAIVVAGHIAQMFFSETGSTANQVIFFLSSYNHAAVIVFFVLSGYLVGGSVIRRREELDIKRYAVDRFSRIYIVLVPAIFLIVICDFIGMRLSGASIYDEVWATGISGSGPISQRYQVEDWISTILSVESIFGKAIGSGGPLWSLGYEWVFYFTLPLLVVVGRGKLSAIIIGVVLVAVLLAAVDRLYFAAFWLIWCSGAFAAHLRGTFTAPSWLTSVFGILAVLVFLVSPAINQRIADPALGLSLAIFLLRRVENESSLFPAADKFLASGSYSLYVTHFPLMVLSGAVLQASGVYLPNTGLPVSWGSTAMALTIFAITLGVAYFFKVAFEDNTPRLRHMIYNLISNFRKAPA